MKKLKLLSNFRHIFYFTVAVLSSIEIVYSNEPVDIWSLEKNETNIVEVDEVNSKKSISKSENSN